MMLGCLQHYLQRFAGWVFSMCCCCCLFVAWVFSMCCCCLCVCRVTVFDVLLFVCLSCDCFRCVVVCVFVVWVFSMCCCCLCVCHAWVFSMCCCCLCVCRVSVFDVLLLFVCLLRECCRCLCVCHVSVFNVLSLFVCLLRECFWCVVVVCVFVGWVFSMCWGCLCVCYLSVFDVLLLLVCLTRTGSGSCLVNRQTSYLCTTSLAAGAPQTQHCLWNGWIDQQFFESTRSKHNTSSVLKSASSAQRWKIERLKREQRKQTNSRLKWINSVISLAQCKVRKS